MYNKAFLIGNLTRDPEVRYTTSGIAVARFGIAVNRYTSKAAGSSDAGNDVDFINIVAWRKLAEICKNYLKKGQPVAIEGSLQIRKYEKDGQQKVFAEVVAENMQMLGRKQDAGQKIVQDVPETAASSEAKTKSDDEEVPF
jgi:single-strand DNA-binding protein